MGLVCPATNNVIDRKSIVRNGFIVCSKIVITTNVSMFSQKEKRRYSYFDDHVFLFY